jgi:phospho-N-acetylmuramoyl-pentapeptide-transferase
MLYYLFEYLDKILDVPGTGVFQYITFRSALVHFFLLLSTIYGKRIIRFLQRQQVGETVRELGLVKMKSGYTNNGRIDYHICDCCLFAKLHNIYIVLPCNYTMWMGTIGFIDDDIKIFKKRKAGLKNTKW